MQHEADKSIRGLLIAQFFGAFNDNCFKLVAALLAITAVKGQVGDSGADYEAAAQAETTLAFVVFTLPLMLMSLPAALWVDRFSKRSVLILTKVVELVLMIAGTIALYVEPSGGLPALIVLAAMGAQSALFSPAKYGILPQILPPERLVAGNGKVETWTMLAIIGGTVAAGGLLDAFGGSTWLVGAVLTVFSVVGLVNIRSLPEVPAVGAASGVRHAYRGAFHALRGNRVLWLAALGSVFFWAIASLVSQNALIYAKVVLDLEEARAPVPLGASGIGIAVGAYLVGLLTRSRLELGWIPLGTLGIALTSAAIGAFEPGFEGTLFWMFALGVVSGFVLVPVNTLIQAHSPDDQRGAVIAVVNAAQFGGVLAGSLGCLALSQYGASASDIFVGAALATLLATAWAIWLLPQAGVRLILVLLTQTLYRLRVRGKVQVPEEGGALLVCNHVSFVDGLLLSASIDRPIRFVVDEFYYNKPLLKPFMKLFGFVPIAQDAPPRELLASIRKAGEALDDGELVCIFAEGEITRTGQMLPFRRGFSRITKSRDVPIVPVHLDRVWGTLTSFSKGGLWRALWSFPRRITVSIGAQEPPTIGGPELQAKIRELESIAWRDRIDEAGPLHASFLRAVRRTPWKLAAADERKPRVSRLGLLTMSVALARALRDTWRGQQNVGLLLPPSVGGAATNIAASLAGKTSVNLNFTTGPDAMQAAAKRAELKTVITNREFLEKAGVELPEGVEPIWIEDLAPSIGFGAKLFATLASLFTSRRMLERLCGAARAVEATDPATVIFSSGSTGEPKGVVLSHFNICSNAEGVAQSLTLSKDDRLLGSLPLFHSFGTMGMWFAMQQGIGIVFCANPLDAGLVGKLVHDFNLTMLIATPTFLQIYTRRCTPGQFGSLRLVVVGAEKLPDRVAHAFEEKFGVKPLEGYGATECAPVVAMNTPGFRAPGYYQAGSRRGSVGQPLPGIAVRVVDPDTREPLPVGESGLLMVTGPNIMQGYLGREDLTADVLDDGWYATGDIAKVDTDGFVSITDRLARFSKIGGEMVPHGKVETVLHDVVGSVDQCFAVTGVPSEKKGEQLAVLHTRDESEIRSIVDQLAERGLPNLFVPRPEAFVKVDELPLLGTGKLDLKAVRSIAMERLGVKV